MNISPILQWSEMWWKQSNKQSVYDSELKKKYEVIAKGFEETNSRGGFYHTRDFSYCICLPPPAIDWWISYTRLYRPLIWLK